MKSKMVKVFSSAVLCGVLAVSALPVESMAAEQGCEHEKRSYRGWRTDYDCLEAFHHRKNDIILYHCMDCNEDFEIVIRVTDEDHDMEWIDYDAGILRCKCGYEERWQ